MSRPLLLDLFCCAGGAAGFDVVGVDIDPQPNYRHSFQQADAVEFLGLLLAGEIISGYRLEDFAAIHASPPCQSYLNLGAVNRAIGRTYDHPDLVDITRELLTKAGKPWVIENVEGAPLRKPFRLCGSSFGLPIRRHRCFESSEPLTGAPCNHRWQRIPRYWTSWRPTKGESKRACVVQVYGNGGHQHEWGPAMGIDWMTGRELAEAIPPVYTEFVGRQLLAVVALREHQAVAA